MVDKSDWKQMKQLAFDAFKRDGIMSVAVLEQIVDIALEDGEFDDHEKDVLIEIISNLTGDEMNDAMWLKVDELIHKFDLHGDSEAFIEHLDDDEFDDFEEYEKY
jgi:hypothetical protein